MVYLHHYSSTLTQSTKAKALLIKQKERKTHSLHMIIYLDDSEEST